MSMHLITSSINFHHAPVEVRERLAFRSERLAGALCHLHLRLGLQEAVLLSTCNRVEFYGCAADPERALARWSQFLREYHRTDFDPAPFCSSAQSRGCAEHLFRLASGLESMVVGETEILGQVKAAYEVALSQGLARKALNRLFQSCFQAAKAVRSSTNITRGNVSVGSVAVDLARRLFGSLQQRQVMILGAGEMSERTARALQSEGVASLFVANRTFDHAQALARELGGEAVHWDRFSEFMPRVDIIIASTAAPHFVLTRERLLPLLPQRRGNPLFLIDLAVPRNLEPALHTLPDVYLYDIDDLQSIARRNQEERISEIARCHTILLPYVDKYMQWLATHPVSMEPGVRSGGATFSPAPRASSQPHFA